LDLIFQGSLARCRDLEREKLASARLAGISVRELFLKSSSGSGEFCVQDFLDLLVFVIILRSKGKTTLGGCEIRSCRSIARHFRFIQHFARIERIKTTPPPTCQYILSREAFLASAVIEDIKSSASYLRIA
jgi:hypothetical protein